MREETYKAIRLLLKSDETVTPAQQEAILSAFEPIVGKIVSSLPCVATARDPAGYIRRKEAAKYLGVTVRCLTKWQARRIIPYHKVSRRCCLYRKPDLDKAMNRFRLKAVGEPL